MSDHMFVVTGGPGSGKSSLIDALTRRGFRAMPEAGRAIIQDQVRIGGSALPWADRALFAELMLGWELRSWREALAMDGPVLMDRGIPDVVGYAVHFVKANGGTRPKVFKLRSLTMQPGEIAALSATVSLVPMTTRRHFPGHHRIDALVNGEAHPLGGFEVAA